MPGTRLVISAMHHASSRSSMTHTPNRLGHRSGCRNELKVAEEDRKGEERPEDKLRSNERDHTGWRTELLMVYIGC